MIGAKKNRRRALGPIDRLALALTLTVAFGCGGGTMTSATGSGGTSSGGTDPTEQASTGGASTSGGTETEGTSEGTSGLPGEEPLATIEELSMWLAVLDKHSPNRSGDAAHEAYVSWLEGEFGALGLAVSERSHAVADQVITLAELEVDSMMGTEVAVLSAVPRGGADGA